MVDFQAVKVARISDAIVTQIEDMILEGLLKAGERLPPERVLAERLNVSRPSLREAIVILESKGLLQSRRGGGTFVCDFARPSLTDPLLALLQAHPEMTGDVLELRHALEETAAFHAAQRATETDLRKIERCLRKLEEIYEAPNLDREREVQADVAFHLAIAEASHNLALVHVMRSLLDVLHNSITFNLDRIRENVRDHAEIRHQHGAMFEAIAAGEAEAAGQAAREHLAFVAKTLSENRILQAREERAKRRADLP
jgi:GntR family transcriptional repressor for pyruvate dehydrogenase complex